MNDVEEQGLFVRGLSYMVYYNVLCENLLCKKQAEKENKNTKKTSRPKGGHFHSRCTYHYLVGGSSIPRSCFV